MNLSLLFWLIYIAVFVLGYYATWETDKYRAWGHHTLLMLFVGIIGWSVYSFIPN